VELPDDLQHELDQALRSAAGFSFDLERLKLQINSGDTLTTVIKAHLYLEHVLIFFLRQSFSQPDEINLKRISFPTKVDLCIALGLIDKELRAPLNKVNEMRNRVAHTLDVEINDQERKEFWMSLPPRLRRARLEILKISDVENPDIRFPQIFDGLIVWLDICRQQYIQGRIKMDFARLNLKRVLDETAHHEEPFSAKDRSGEAPAID
jgi:hypothetical protein